MPILSVDLEPLIRRVQDTMPKESELRRALTGLGAAARAEWVKLAQAELKSTRRDYVQGIQQPEMGSNKVSIALVGQLPNMIEQGWKGGDMRRHLLGPNARNVKTTKDGHKYNVVPFGHGTPGSSGANAGPPMPKPLHNVAKHLAATKSAPKGGKTKWGERLTPEKTTGKAKKLLETKMRPHHTTSVHTGMVRQEKTYAKATQSKYTTFRTISSRVSRGWIHPGIQPRNLAKKVEKYIVRIAGRILESSL